ncbi:hypothetical protein NJE57_19945, partial [Dietzia sp. PP-33]|nr:hypothetical protein [Dietzia sp. PP-33]
MPCRTHTHSPEFADVLAPFTAQGFATGIAQSNAGIGPLALLTMPDGTLIASGGAGRNELYRFNAGGG